MGTTGCEAIVFNPEGEKLGAGPVIDFTMASRTIGFDLIGKKWSQEILRKLGVDSGVFSDAQTSGTVVGGGANSPLWLRIKADILGSPILTLRGSQAACLGSAILAGAAAGIYSDVDEGAATLVRTRDPDDERSQAYAARYGVYEDLYPALKSINRRLS